MTARVFTNNKISGQLSHCVGITGARCDSDAMHPIADHAENLVVQSVLQFDGPVVCA
jgi:hypothetical protein